MIANMGTINEGKRLLVDRYEPGQAYSPDTFVDPDGFRAEVEQQLAEEQR